MIRLMSVLVAISCVGPCLTAAEGSSLAPAPTERWFLECQAQTLKASAAESLATDRGIQIASLQREKIALERQVADMQRELAAAKTQASSTITQQAAQIQSLTATVEPHGKQLAAADRIVRMISIGIYNQDMMRRLSNEAYLYVSRFSESRSATAAAR